MISAKEREILRSLAARQMEIAHSPVNLERIALWKAHSAMHGQRPIVHIELETFENDLIPQRLQCRDPMARKLEHDLWMTFFNLSELDDDWVVPDYFPVQRSLWFHPFGYNITRTEASDPSGGTLGHRFNYVIDDLEEDWEKLGPSTYGVDTEKDAAYFQLAGEVFGDILPPKMTNMCLYACLAQDVVHMMGMENMCFALYDYPELFHRMMDRLSDDYLAFFHRMEQDGLLLPTTGFELLAQGSKCFTDELPSEGPIRVKDMWGFMDSQESVSISPDQYKEFMFPYYNKIACRFGRLSYACCEPVDPVWDTISRFPTLRKVSISPWANEEIMAERLRGSKIIYHRKPSPNFLGVGETLDEEAFRKHIRKTLRLAQGCELEITQRDVYTVNHDLDKVKRFIRIIREEIDSNWNA